MSHEEELAALRASTDQAAEALAEVAHLIARYFRELIEQDFSRGEALTLTVAYQTTILQGNFGSDEP